MSEYTSTREGFQRAMKWALTGPPKDSHLYAEATAMPTFYHIANGKRLAWNAYIKNIEEWRPKITDYEPVIHEFLRDGDQLAARITGVLKIEGADNEFESFMFAKINQESGKLEWLVERSVWGPVGQAPDHGTN